VGIFGSKVDVTKILFAVQSRANTFCSKIYFQVDTVVNDDVKFVLKLLNFISVTNNINNFLLVRFENTMSLDNLPN